MQRIENDFLTIKLPTTLIDFLRTYKDGLLLIGIVTFLAAIIPFAGYVLYPLMLFLLLRKQAYLLFLFAFLWLLILSDFKVEPGTNPPIAFAKSVKNLGAVLLLFLVLSNKKIRMQRNGIIVGFIPFFAVLFFALIYAGDPLLGIQKNISYLILMYSVPKLLFYEWQKNGDKTFVDLIFFISGILVFCFPFTLIAPTEEFAGGIRFSGIFGNPNGLAIFSICFFALLLVFKPVIIRRTGLRQFWLIVGVIALTIFLSGSRNGVLSMLILWLFYTFFKESPGISLVLMLSILSLVVLIDVNLVSVLKQLGMEQYFRIQTLEGGSGRAVAWAFSLDKIEDYFFFGGGLGNDEYIIRQHYFVLTRLGHEGGVHNSYLSMWFDAGIIGLSAYFIALVSFFVRMNKVNKAALPILFTVLFNITFESWLVASLNPFTIVLFMVMTGLWLCNEPVKLEPV